MLPSLNSEGLPSQDWGDQSQRIEAALAVWCTDISRLTPKEIKGPCCVEGLGLDGTQPKTAAAGGSDTKLVARFHGDRGLSG